MPISERDRWEILSLHPMFQKDLERLWELDSRAPMTIGELFPEDHSERLRLDLEKQEALSLRARLRSVGIDNPVHPREVPAVLQQLRSQEAEAQTQVRALRQFTRINESTQGLNSEVYGFIYDIQEGGIITLQIDVFSAEPAQLASAVKRCIREAREQIGNRRKRGPAVDIWDIWRQHSIENKSRNEIARDITGEPGDPDSCDTLKAKAIEAGRAIQRAKSMISALTYPPAKEASPSYFI